MADLIVGIPTFGGHEYTAQAFEALSDADLSMEVVVVAGKPGTAERLNDMLGNLHDSTRGRISTRLIPHSKNRGLPAALNGIMDYAFKERGADQVMWLANDAVPYLDGIENLLKAAALHSYFDYYTGREMTPRGFLARYPQYRYDFDSNLKPLRFPFHGHMKHWSDLQRQDLKLAGGVRQIYYTGGFHNFSLMRRSFFDKVGYVDAGFFPAYYEDIDYVRRGGFAKVKMAEAVGSWYFHFNGRTKDEVHGEATHRRYFHLNEIYYKSKWGGLPGHETYNVPFAGVEPEPAKDRENDERRVEFWKWTPLEFRNRHKGQRCIIACNGPSLNDIDMSLLKDEIVFGLNRFQLKSDMKPTYGVATNRLFLSQFGFHLAMADVEAWFIPPMDKLWQPHTYGLMLDGGPARFTKDASQSMWEGHTVTFVALQLAFFMGFDTAIIIGMDHEYKGINNLPPDATIDSGGADPNHFSPDYFGKGVRWQTPNLPKSEEAYKLALSTYEAAGRRIINCSTRTACDVFPRGELSEVLMANVNTTTMADAVKKKVKRGK